MGQHLHLPRTLGKKSPWGASERGEGGSWERGGVDVVGTRVVQYRTDNSDFTERTAPPPARGLATAPVPIPVLVYAPSLRPAAAKVLAVDVVVSAHGTDGVASRRLVGELEAARAVEDVVDLVDEVCERRHLARVVGVADGQTRRWRVRRCLRHYE